MQQRHYSQESNNENGVKSLTDVEKNLFIKRIVGAIVQKYPDLPSGKIMSRLGFCGKSLKNCWSKVDGQIALDRRRAKDTRDERRRQEKATYAKTLVSRVMKENPHFDVDKVKQTVNRLLNLVSRCGESLIYKTDSEDALDVELNSIDCIDHDMDFDVKMEGASIKNAVHATHRGEPSHEPRLKLPNPPSCPPSCLSCQSQSLFAPWIDTDFAKLQSKLRSQDSRFRSHDPDVSMKGDSYLKDSSANVLDESFGQSVPKKSMSQRNPCSFENERRAQKSSSASNVEIDRMRVKVKNCLEKLCLKENNVPQIRRQWKTSGAKRRPVRINRAHSNKYLHSSWPRKTAEHRGVPFGDGWPTCPTNHKYSVPPKAQTSDYCDEDSYFPSEWYYSTNLNQEDLIDMYYPETTQSYDTSFCAQPLPEEYDNYGRNGIFITSDPSQYHCLQPLPSHKMSFAERNPCSVYHCLPDDGKWKTNERPKPNVRLTRGKRFIHFDPDNYYSSLASKIPAPPYAYSAINPCF